MINFWANIGLMLKSAKRKIGNWRSNLAALDLTFEVRKLTLVSLREFGVRRLTLNGICSRCLRFLK
jgi:hypothetical protein